MPQTKRAYPNYRRPGREPTPPAPPWRIATAMSAAAWEQRRDRRAATIRGLPFRDHRSLAELEAAHG